ncbi:NADH-quinone oxidoreductase subunit N [Hufsiella ginkgonis]|uniref:NADH-quinone oxidoreductase subunit N n=1 Tax=Hufsiella ginkgonis TaxID=2695274 RepID=A0A7K1Y2K5_9SPHI|nr:NADH-quinone oxidoreductase subunit N [Hufsiella ginkgonis]MXV17514.1 NADH-quinone oxidoreductase subunit NuoN [Hufsiella ginkgonis]
MNALITISVLAVLVLYLGLYKANKALLPVTLLGLAVALFFTINHWNVFTGPTFNDMMSYDNFAVAFSGITITSTMLILLLSKGYFEKISDHVAEYYSIILFSLAGILVMVSYHNMTMLFIGIEIMSVSLYILAGIRKQDFASNEAALKYFLMGAFSTGFLLFGVALIYGAAHSFDLEAIKMHLETNLQTGQAISPLFYTGVVLMAVGMAFKVGAAPFHFWTPDVYEGSPSLITAFMSTVVKTAGFAAFLRLFATCFYPLHDFWMPVILVITIITLFAGNITALYQNNFKRMLAWSSISHAGYMLFAIVSLGSEASYGVFVYAIAYSAASIIAFAGLVLMQANTGSDSFDSFNGLGRKNPFLAFTLTVAMLSLAGIPLTAGFIGKFIMFSNALSSMHTWLVVLAVINAVISIFYYFRVIVAMYFKDAERAELEIPLNFKVVLAISVVATILIGIWPAFLPNVI